MERVLCIWYPTWGLSGDGSSPGEALVDDTGTVVAVDERAAARGIRPGMRRREAEARAPTVRIRVRDPVGELRAFEEVVAAVEEIVPGVEVIEPGLLAVPVGGAIRYFGGEAEVVAAVVEALEGTTGSGYRIGVAAGPFAARRAAERTTPAEPVLVVDDDAAFLASLDLAEAGSAELAATFRWLGVTTLGELAALPREAVVARFGKEGLTVHRRAVGEEEPLRPRDVPVERGVEERFDPPCADLERVAFAGRRLARRLLEPLRAEGVAPHRVEILLEAADGTSRTRSWRSLDPFDERSLAERVRWQCRAWIDDGGVPGGVRCLRLVPDATGPGRQLDLTADLASRQQARRSLAEVQAIVGPDRVLRAAPQGGREPGERVRWYRWGEEAGRPRRDPAAPWPGKLPPPSPTLVPPEPRPVTVEWEDGMPVRMRLGSRWEPIRSWSGPWRRSGRWWIGEGPVDRYQLVTSAGAFLCEVREGRTYLSGVYD